MRVTLALLFLDFLLSPFCLSFHSSGSEAQLKPYRRGCDPGKRIWEDQRSWEGQPFWEGQRFWEGLRFREGLRFQEGQRS